MGDTVLSAKLDEEADLYEDFQEFQEEYQTRSEAVRAAIRAGISDDDDTRRDTLSSRLQVGLTALVMITLGFAVAGVLAISFAAAGAVSMAVPWTLALLTVAYAVISVAVFSMPHRTRSILRMIESRVTEQTEAS